MKWSILLLIALFGCESQPDIVMDDFERERAIIAKNGVIASRAYEINKDGSERLRTEMFYYDDGYLTKLIMHVDDTDPITSEYLYDENDIVVEIRNVNANGEVSTTMFKEFTESDMKEVDVEVIGPSEYMSVYTNDESGRNIHKEYYRDSVLIGTYEFHWSTFSEPDSIVNYSPEGKRIGHLVNVFEEGKLIESNRFEYSELVEHERWKYDSNGRQIENFVRVVNDFESKLEIIYLEDLRHKEVTTFIGADGDYEAKSETIWRHEKKHKHNTSYAPCPHHPTHGMLWNLCPGYGTVDS